MKSALDAAYFRAMKNGNEIASEAEVYDQKYAMRSLQLKSTHDKTLIPISAHYILGFLTNGTPKSWLLVI